MSRSSYWEECIEMAAEDCELTITPSQIRSLAGSVEISHENYGMAFYSPPAGERLQQIESEWEKKYKALQTEFDKYRNNAETAVKQALRQRSDSSVQIGEYGEVTRYDGRTERIQ